MRIAFATDAWAPQTNGVVRTLSVTAQELERGGHEVEVLHPGAFRTLPCPSYPEIRLALFPYRGLARRLARFAPEAVHIATEGPVGMAARRWCRRHRRPFTTSYHTQFPEYLRARAPIPTALTYAHLRRFHGGATRTLVATDSMRRQLESRGFTNIAPWTRGVDSNLFRPRGKGYASLPRPLWLYFGRVAVEKGIEDFLELELPGTKLVVGGGPAEGQLRLRFPRAVFTGFRYGEELATLIAACDVFVFPSRTDTFGLVLLEAMASGVPVAAYPVTGPIDVVIDGVTGVLDPDLRKAALGALRLDPAACRAHALNYSWAVATQQFLSHLAT